MAGLGHFGIKEVADVRFYNPSDVKYVNGAFTVTASEPLLEFTTLKVSNLEFTAEQSEARGGKGNAPLIIWDYGREVNITLEDALLSVNCMRKIFGDNGTGKAITIGANTFPGNVAVVGVTFARDQETGDDHLFTFYVPNAKISSEITLTMEAEGDPTVFSMNLRALRASKDDDTMVTLIPFDTKYDGTDIFAGGMEAQTTTTYYNITFVYNDKSVKSYKVAAGETINPPANTEGFEWPEVARTATANALYTEVTE